MRRLRRPCCCCRALAALPALLPVLAAVLSWDQGPRPSQPPLLRLIPAGVLEATGRTLLAGILLSIKNRVGQQLLADFEAWCLETPA